MKKIILYQIAGFNIKIIYNNTSDIVAQRIIKSDISLFLRNFIIKTNNKKFDFVIEFIHNDVTKTIYKPKQQEVYALLYIIESNSIKTFYHLSIQQFEVILRGILFKLLSRSKGFYLHGSAIEINGKAHVFLGNSGAGKSTIVRLLRKSFYAFADDQLIIRKINNDYYCYSSPYRQKQSWINNNPKRYMLKAMYFLNKSNKYKTIKIINKEGIVKLFFDQIYSEFAIDKKQSRKILKFLSQFDNYYQMFFGKDYKKISEIIKTLDFS
ncbi:MAG: hypothetical protein M1326_00090 [Cyanobacteria bacterium]|nr:hypothetical protein [Cyanobacteriota bacterium]